MKIINWILALSWTSWVIVQYNDPDPIQWMSMYGLVVVVCVMAAYKKYSQPLIAIGIVVSIIWAATLMPSVIDYFSNHKSNEIFENMTPSKLFIEEARECFGLIISALVLIWKFSESQKAKRAEH
jgi:hypothetical protein